MTFLCQVGRKTLSQSINRPICVYRMNDFRGNGGEQKRKMRVDRLQLTKKLLFKWLLLWTLQILLFF